MQNAHSVRGTKQLSGGSAIKILACVVLFAFAGILECGQLASLRDPEVWGHLRTGAWILQNKVLPDSGMYSQAQALPWRDYSWGYDVAVALGYKLLGLRVFPALLVFFRFALAVIAFQLAGGWRNFWPAVVLCVAAQAVLYPMGPVAGGASVLLFGVVLLILFETRRSPKPRLLLVLPAIFLLWANLDTGFVYGILLYLLFLAVLPLEARIGDQSPYSLIPAEAKPPLKLAVLAGGASVLAALLNPSTIRPIVAFFADEFSPVNSELPGYASMRFRQPQDYLLMLLAMTAFLALGLRRSRDLFQLSALAASAALAFHAQREGWLLALVSVAVIGDAFLRSRDAALRAPSAIGVRGQVAIGAAALAISFLFFAVFVPLRQDALLGKIANYFPVRAADYLRSHPQPQSLFNTYRWGGFLAWYLPEYPVAIDSRRNLYPDETVLDYFRVMKGELPYHEFPPMDRAQTLLLERNTPMGDVLRSVAGFHVIYEDDISVVYSHDAMISGGQPGT